MARTGRPSRSRRRRSRRTSGTSTGSSGCGSASRLIPASPASGPPHLGYRPETPSVSRRPCTARLRSAGRRVASGPCCPSSGRESRAFVPTRPVRGQAFAHRVTRVPGSPSSARIPRCRPPQPDERAGHGGHRGDDRTQHGQATASGRGVPGPPAAGRDSRPDDHRIADCAAWPIDVPTVLLFAKCAQQRRRGHRRFSHQLRAAEWAWLVSTATISQFGSKEGMDVAIAMYRDGTVSDRHKRRTHHSLARRAAL